MNSRASIVAVTECGLRHIVKELFTNRQVMNVSLARECIH